MPWWWGSCAGSSCCTEAALLPSGAPIYEDLRPLAVDPVVLGADGAEDASAVIKSHSRRRDESIVDGARTPGVYTARHRLTQELLAVKVLPRSVLKAGDARRSLRREVRILNKCRSHPNLLTLHGVYSTGANVELAFELARGGDVLNRILAPMPALLPSPRLSINSVASFTSVTAAPTSRSYRFSEAEVSRVIAGVASGLAFLHGQGIVHGELRPEHVLYVDTEQDARVLVVGFGRAAPWRQMNFRLRTRKAAFLWDDLHHLRFLPPFLLRRRRRVGASTDADKHLIRRWREAQQIDSWALGVMAHMLLCAEYPFDAERGGDESVGRSLEERILKDDLTFPDPSSLPLSRAAKDFVLRLLTKHPDNAMTIQEVLEHPWINSQVASDVLWDASTLEKHQRFATQYALEMEPSTSRHRVAGLSNGITSGSGIIPGRAYRVVDQTGSGDEHLSTRDADDEIDDVFGGRPSYVSTDGQELYLPEEQRPSAEGYMRLADDEIEQLLMEQAAAAASTEVAVNSIANNGGRDDFEEYPSTTPETYKQDGRQRSLDKMWEILIRQRRFLSFKSSSSFNSSGKASDKISV